MPEPYRRPLCTCPRLARRPIGSKQKHAALAEAEALKLQARLEDLNVCEREFVKENKKGSKIYTYWMPPGERATRPAVSIWGAPGRWMLGKPVRRPGK